MLEQARSREQSSFVETMGSGEILHGDCDLFCLNAFEQCTRYLETMPMHKIVCSAYIMK